MDALVSWFKRNAAIQGTLGSGNVQVFKKIIYIIILLK